MEAEEYQGHTRPRKTLEQAHKEAELYALLAIAQQLEMLQSRLIPIENKFTFGE